VKKRNPLLKLAGLPEALANVDAAISQGSHLQKLMRFRGLPALALVTPPLPPLVIVACSPNQLEFQIWFLIVGGCLY